MKTSTGSTGIRLWLAALVLGGLAACSGGGGRDTIFGANATAALPPTVTSVVPLNNAAGVPTNQGVITAVFSEAMQPLTGAATFTLACAAPCVPPTGTVALDAASRIATLTLPAGNSLAVGTTYTATITGAQSVVTGLPLASPYVWKFTTAFLPPTVTSVAPLNNAVGVPTNLKVVTAAFSETIQPFTGAATFTLACALPCVAPTGPVTLDSTARVAILTLPTAGSLSPVTTYTATVTGARSVATSLTLASPFVWKFTTGLLADVIRPRVTLTVPATTIPGPTLAVPANTAISALFSEDMDPTTVSNASFLVACALPCVSPAGTVTYSVGARTAVFTPAAPLSVSTTYTATVTIAATDIAGNALAGNQAALPAASNYVWTFTTVAAVPPSPVTVLSTVPAAGAPAVCSNAGVNATFGVPSGLRMDPLTVTSLNFTVIGPAPAFTPVVATSVVLDPATGRIATFTPLADLTPGLTYVATVKGGGTGVKDLAVPANSMASNTTWSFTVTACLAPGAVPLGSASTFGIMATAATTSTGPTQINGDVALNPGTSQGIPPAQVNGTIHVKDSIAAAAQVDLLAAYNFAKALPPGAAAPFALGGGADLSGLVLPPGTYTSGSTVLINGPAPVTLDGGGNTNAVWVFQIGSSITTVTGSVLLVGGAQAKNVFWVPTADATIGVGTTFEGSILAGRDATGQTGATINGRILAGAITAGTIALDSNTVNVPAP